MKWDWKNKKRLYFLLHRKMVSVCSYQRDYEVWRAFCRSLGILDAYRDDGHSEWLLEGKTPNLYDTPAANHKNIIIKDPWFGERQVECGLSIPKDVAEKFLVLGIP